MTVAGVGVRPFGARHKAGHLCRVAGVHNLHLHTSSQCVHVPRRSSIVAEARAEGALQPPC